MSFDTAYFLAWLVMFPIGITLHYATQAFVANRLGDNTPRRDGRMSLNPANHLDAFGLLLAFLLAVSPGFPGVAWGKPVKFNSYALRGGRLANLLVYLSGSLANLLTAIVITLLAGPYIAQYLRTGQFLPDLLYSLVVVNIFLFAYNLYIPLAPLDGLGVWRSILPVEWLPKLEVLETYGPYILIVLIFLVPAFLGHLDLLGFVIKPLVNAILNLLGLPNFF